jgi:VIT1/CCC1 family predicted Fe2+/Mn2+ transporter
MSNEPELSRRLSELESRLDAYHAQLEAALEHDRQFQLGAAWGIVSGLLALAALAAILVTGLAWLKDSGVFWWAAAAIAYSILATVIVGLIAGWVEKKRKQDALKLSSLPQWHHGTTRQ